EPTLDGPGLGPVRARRHDRERLVEDAREHVARPHAAPRQAQDLVELPARGIDLEREPLDQQVVLVPGDVEVFAVVGEHVSSAVLEARARAPSAGAPSATRRAAGTDGAA